MYQVIVDKVHNRIVMQLKGFLLEDEMTKAANEVKNGIDILKPNFDVINDISDFKPASQVVRELIKEVQVYAVSKNIARVVRVTGNVIGKIQFDRTSKEAGYIAVTVNTLDEAYKILDDQKNSQSRK